MARRSRKTVPSVCKGCDVEFLADPCEIKRGNGKFCSRNCQRSYQAKINAVNMSSGMTRRELGRKYRKNTPPEVIRAHHMVEWAIESGKLVRGPCEVCGAERVDGHHDDYSRPLDVRWLCRGHHIQHHKIMKEKD